MRRHNEHLGRVLHCQRHNPAWQPSPTLPGDKFPAHTATTITTRKALREELEKVAKQGYAVDNEELDLGVHCVAAPIRDYTRRIVGSISISGPNMRLGKERIVKEMVPLVLSASEELSSRLGYNK